MWKSECRKNYVKNMRKVKGMTNIFSLGITDIRCFAIVGKAWLLQRLLNVREIPLLSLFSLSPCIRLSAPTLFLLSFAFSLSLCYWLSPFLCSCPLPRETKSGVEGKLMKTGICGNREGDGEGGRMKRWGPSGDECNRSGMIMTSQLLSTPLSLHSCCVIGKNLQSTHVPQCLI